MKRKVPSSYETLLDFAEGARGFEVGYQMLIDAIEAQNDPDVAEHLAPFMEKVDEQDNIANPFWEIFLLSGDHDFAFIVVEDRKWVIATNPLANEYFDFSVGALPAETALPIAAGLSDLEKTSANFQTAFSWSSKLQREIQISLFLNPKLRVGPQQEIFILHDPEQIPKIDGFAARHGLTGAEEAIVALFFAGRSLNEIATLRGRSEKTVRTQFYRTLNKCGCNNRLQLMKAIETHLQLESLDNELANSSGKDERQEYIIEDENGRSIEVQSNGNGGGDLVITVREDSFWRLPERYNSPLKAHGINYFCISPPCFGRTSPPPLGQTIEECLAEDITYLMNTLGYEKAVVHCTFNTVLLSLKAGSIIPDRISGLVITNIVAPRNRRLYDSKKNWLSSALSIFLDKSGFAHDWIAKAYFVYVAKIGVKRFFKAFYAHDKAGLAAMLDPEVLADAQTAFTASISNGLEFNISAVRTSVFEDWEHELEACPFPVHIRVGETDDCGPMSALESLAVDYPQKVFLSTVGGFGMAYVYQTIDPLIDVLKTAIGGSNRPS